MVLEQETIVTVQRGTHAHDWGRSKRGTNALTRKVLRRWSDLDRHSNLPATIAGAESN